MNAYDDTPAFPEAGSGALPNGDFHFGRSGMTLRDYFAAKAMHAELMTSGVPGESCDAFIAAMEPGESVEDHLANVSYLVADAMLRRRLKE